MGHARGNKPITTHQYGSVYNIEKPKNIGHNPKLPCKICKGDHLLIHFPGIQKGLEVLSQDSQQPISPSTAGHAHDSSSTSDNKVEGRKDKVKFHYKLCRGMNLTYHFPHIGEAS